MSDFSLGPNPIGCVIFAEPRDACEHVHFKPIVDSNFYCETYFAFVERGNCTFSKKAYNVQTASPFGFHSMIVYNDISKGDPIPMAGYIHDNEVSIPSIMISYWCMNLVMEYYSASKGFAVTMKSPNDSENNLVPILVIVGVCLVILAIALVGIHILYKIINCLHLDNWIHLQRKRIREKS